jgi:hypothetical protein
MLLVLWLREGSQGDEDTPQADNAPNHDIDRARLGNSRATPSVTARDTWRLRDPASEASPTRQTGVLIRRAHSTRRRLGLTGRYPRGRGHTQDLDGSCGRCFAAKMEPQASFSRTDWSNAADVRAELGGPWTARS